MAEGLWDLKNGLRELRSDLVVRVGRMGDVVEDLLKSEQLKGKVGAVWITKDWASEETAEEREIGRAVAKAGEDKVGWKVWYGEEMFIHE